MPIDKKTLDEYLAKTDLKYVEEKMEKEKAKPAEIIREARDAFVKAEFALSATELAQIQEDTRFEEVIGVGFHPQDKLLAAVIEVKLTYGYGGTVPCGSGSDQFVGFYVDWGGNNFKYPQDMTYGVTGVHVFDPGESNADRLPLNYAVHMPVFVPDFVTDGTVAKVRAILSWEVPPSGVNFKPRWGNVIDRWIRYHR
ncbi:MAG: hypothetical protein AYK19_11145 [Theionarchaea archaeon DG-70-1]|nr:MAG: hypothetical protein AYK19_11145 [Theionarchaea archaeon DG-70-1]